MLRSRAYGFWSLFEFETLTLVPFDRRAIDVKGLSDKELGLLNAYHQRVYEEIGPHLTPKKEIGCRKNAVNRIKTSILSCEDNMDVF